MHDCDLVKTRDLSLRVQHECNTMIVWDHLDHVLIGRQGQIISIDSNGQVW